MKFVTILLLIVSGSVFGQQWNDIAHDFTKMLARNSEIILDLQKSVTDSTASLYESRELIAELKDQNLQLRLFNIDVDREYAKMTAENELLRQQVSGLAYGNMRRNTIIVSLSAALFLIIILIGVSIYFKVARFQLPF